MYRRTLLAWTFVALFGATTAMAENVTILGGGLTGQPYQFAVSLTKILADGNEVTATAQSSKGMVAQARLLDRDEADFAFGIGGPIGAWAYQGVERFQDEGAKTHLRSVLAYPAGSLHWLALADSDIDEVSDLEGKRVSLGGASSTTQTFGRLLLEAHGIGPDDFTEVTPGFTEGFGSLRDGNVDAHLTVGVTPLGAVTELATSQKIRLLEQDEAALQSVIEEYGPGLALGSVAAGTYGDNQVNDEPVDVVDIFFGFSTTDHVDPDTVYAVTRALFESIDEFHAAANGASAVTLETACAGLSFPLHEGAKRYYDEVGAAGCE